MNFPIYKRAPLRFLSLVALSTSLAVGSAQAASLEQKWHQGEQLTYDMALDGTMTIETDANAPVLFAGIPLDVKVTGNADLLVDTREVTPDGSGTLALSFPRVNLKGSAWEQVATLDSKDGTVALTFNGQKMGKDIAAQWLIEPTYALQVSKNARIERIVPLVTANDDAGADDAAVGEAAPAPKADKGRLPINVAGLMRSMALQLLPTLWPGHDVVAGETWTAESRLPVPSKNAAAGGPALEMLPLGKFQMTLGEEEEVAGRRAYRVALQGVLDLDKAKAQRLNNGEGTRLTNAAQKVSGTIWFDAAAGQLVRADLRLTGNMAGVLAMPQKKTGDAVAPFGANQRFDGTLKFLLKTATMKMVMPPLLQK